jgi:hypothetical protein
MATPDSAVVAYWSEHRAQLRQPESQRAQARALTRALVQAGDRPDNEEVLDRSAMSTPAGIRGCTGSGCTCCGPACTWAWPLTAWSSSSAR